MDSDAKEFGHVRVTARKIAWVYQGLDLPRVECDHTFLRCNSAANQNLTNQQTFRQILIQQPKAPIFVVS